MPELTSNNSYSPRRTKSEFPIKVYAMLELADTFFDFAQAVTWLPHGRAFRIHNKTKFMEEVVPVFFNQTKIRSFKRQLHLWGFRRLGRGNDQVWYHSNFLRGKPEDMKHMVRTKIKGCKDADTDISSVVPNFDGMPPLPVCSERPPAILDAMKKAIMQLSNASGAIAAHCCFAVPAATMSVSPQPQLENVAVTPQPQLGNVPYDTNYHMMAMPGSESSCQFNVEYNHDDTFDVPPPPAFHRRVSTGSPVMMQPCMPTMTMKCCLPLLSSIESSQPLVYEMTQHNQETSAQGPPHFEPEQSHDMFNDLSGFCFSSSVQHKPAHEDFEPLPFMDDNTPCDDFASFIEGAIQQIEG